MISRIRAFLNGKFVQTFMFSVIILDCICIGLETYEFFQTEFALGFHYLNIIFTCIYILEIVLKSIFLRGEYFKNGWNIFDILIVDVTLATSLPMLYGLRSLRFCFGSTQNARISAAFFLPPMGNSRFPLAFSRQ